MFPANDAFAAKAQDVEPSNKSLSDWPDTLAPTTPAPRWRLQTDQEAHESRELLNKLERKMHNASKRSRYGTMTKRINRPQDNASSSDDDDDEEYDAQPQFESNEGLSLLWHQRHQDLDDALHQSKDEDIYVHPCSIKQHHDVAEAYRLVCQLFAKSRDDLT
ncbi:hypothetical protein INT43_000344 [Umbelopsis isabellina]|uniref:Uncharacterized protein n=1 Tax=Mortierella isabellina TaxID=91625 RepID=A0A8H7Q2P7_MORIS|nr:hypothetical protein INT43_000344 [Umbelopsis isabellina]